MALVAGVADHPDVQAAQRLFRAWLEGQMVSKHWTGVALGVVSDQELVWAEGFGYANVARKTPVTAQTKFRMASHSKLFTATAIMMLREQGKLRLDDPVSKHLPWFRPQPADPDDPEITIEELLTHSSGLSREAGPHWTELSFPDAAGIRDYVAKNGATYSPEVRWKYSNLALTIAGMVVEAVSGESYQQFVEQRIFGPLAMRDSSVDRPVAGLATGYGRLMPDGSRREFPFVDAKAMGAATGVTSTVEDMAKFVSLQFRKGRPGGAQILSTGALRQMHRVRMLENNWTTGNGIGFSVNRDRDRLYVGHGGSYPGYKTHTWIQLDDKVGVIVLTNADEIVPSELARHLMAVVGTAVARVTRPPEPAPVWDPSWKRFAGRYRSWGGESQIVEMNQRLVLLQPWGPNPEGARLTALGGGRFRLEGATGGAAVGEVVRFEERDGKVVRLYLGNSYSDRVDP
jgi:CubicO group peptidase (beta-lactamase class C family)